MSSVLKTLAVVFDDGVARSFVRGRLVSALLVLGALGLILCAVIVSMLENVVSKLSANVEESARLAAVRLRAACSASSFRSR